MDKPRGTVSPELSGNPIPSSVPAERWVQAEAAAEKIVCRVQPTAESDGRRKEVVDYVQRLIRDLCGCEVLPFGSLPLRTYLPDGDIDLTTVGGARVDDALLNGVVSALERKYQNKTSQFIVKDVRVVRAEVKLVKCLIQNIVVDISFNQLGGMRTLHFLEQADTLIGKDRLFKRSILMIKAWCYYESRILGAHHGLISTYAMETLIMHIFHLFHSELDGPLAVLYRFLDYFSKFDWEKYCISLNGPVRISSLPKIVAEKPQNDGSVLLFSDEFLKKCSDMYSASSNGVDMSQTFQEKHLNIVDPLKENNNLGRSVSKGNFYRICSAFAYGARKLREILLQPEDDIASELCSFFSNTLSRNRDGQRTDVQEPSSPDGKERSELGFSNSIPIKRGNIDKVIKREMKTENSTNGPKEGSSEVVSSMVPPRTDDSTNRTADTGYRISGDSEDLATSTDQTPKSTNETPKDNMPQLAVPFLPHLHFSRPPVVGPKDNGVVSDPVACSPSVLNPSCKPKTSVIAAAVRPVVLEPLAKLREDSERTVSSPPALSPTQILSNHSKQNGFPTANGNVVIPRPDALHMKAILAPHALFRAEPTPKLQGSGTYFPREGQSPCQNGSTENGRSPASVAPPKSPERDKGAPPSSDPFKIAFPKVKVPLPESNIHLNPASVLAQISTGVVPTKGTQNPNPILGLEDSVMTRLSYRLKNEDDFPPLSA